MITPIASQSVINGLMIVKTFAISILGTIIAGIKKI
jgi:hypothetical protein